MDNPRGPQSEARNRDARGGAPRGRGRGGWRGRGQGGGRGRAANNEAGTGGPSAVTVPNPAVAATPNARRGPKPLLTHFLALPIGHHAGLRERMSAFSDALLRAPPVIPGLDRSIIIPPRRLHLTLGVMSLSDNAQIQPGSERPRTLAAARALLKDIQPDILALLAGERLRVALRSMDIMPPERGNLERAHIMWMGPARGTEEFNRLKGVADFILRGFKDAGFVVDEGRPLKLHCTVLNTVYRKPRPKVRTPFSYASVLASPALSTVSTSAVSTTSAKPVEQPTTSSSRTDTSHTSGSAPARGRGPVDVDLGVWDVDEVQICEMGSWGPEGEYVCVGRIPIG